MNLIQTAMEVNNSPRNSNLLNTLKPLIILGFIFSLLSTHTVLAKSRRPVTVSFVRLLGSCFSSFSLDSTESCFNYSGCWNQAKEAGVLRRHREVSVYFKLFLGFFFFFPIPLELGVSVKCSESNSGMWFLLPFFSSYLLLLWWVTIMR